MTPPEQEGPAAKMQAAEELLPVLYSTRFEPD
jgi:hypothetical protein